MYRAYLGEGEFLLPHIFQEYSCSEKKEKRKKKKNKEEEANNIGGLSVWLMVFDVWNFKK